MIVCFTMVCEGSSRALASHWIRVFAMLTLLKGLLLRGKDSK
jgi:hypothetical protein